MNCHTSHIFEYFNYHIQPIVEEIPLYVQDTTSFIRKINQIDFVPNNSYLVSLDVKSFCTNIPMKKESNPSKHPWRVILNEPLQQK